MYGLFDTLQAICREKSMDENSPDNEYDYKKYILMQSDIDTSTLLHIFNFDIWRSTDKDTNCLGLACQANTNLTLIKYLIEEYKMDTKHVNHDNDNCLGLACQKNTNLTVIKYLIEEHKMDVNHINQYNETCLILACWQNTNLQVIKYLIEEHKMDINHINYVGDNCLIMACRKNTNQVIIKYLIEEHKMDINHTNYVDDNCLVMACWKNTNLAIIKYLIEDHKMNIEKINNVPYNKFKNIVSLNYFRKNNLKLNNLLLMGYEEYTDDEMKKLIESINPLQLNDAVINLSGIENPFQQSFHKFTKLVDGLSYRSGPLNKKVMLKKKYGNCQELLFVHNNKEYYGNRSKVYGSIYVLNEILDQYNILDCIVLEGSLPCYAISQYIEACYGTPFKLKNIHEDDYIIFLKFIDQYPSAQISIRGIEDQIIQYSVIYDAREEEYFKTIYARYELKKLYLHMHDLKLALEEEHQDIY
jgi:hypothetical protein